MPGDSGVVRRERGERGEVVAAFSRDRQRGGIQDGRLAATAAEERAGVAVGADRREAGPDVASGGGGAGGGPVTPARYGAVWRFFPHEGITFKKKRARQRTGSRRHRPAAGPLEDVSGPA